MNARAIGLNIGRIILLAVLLMIFFMLGAGISGISETESGAEPEAAGSGLGMLFFSSLLQAAVLSALILRSREAGWKLAGLVFLAFYGSMTVVSQVESLVYLQRQLPQGFVPKIFAMGAIVGALFSPAAVFIMGKMRHKETPVADESLRARPLGEWAWKLLAIALAYLALYYTFGYYLAWKEPAIQAYYGGTDPGSFSAQLANTWASTPWMFPFQAFRGLLWVALVLPLLRTLKGRPWESAVLMALFFAVWSTQLWMPNPYMPDEVRSIHFVETVFCNFIFGWLVGWLFHR